MKTLVAVPTFNNISSGYTINQTLEGLTSQKWKDFRLLVIYKHHPQDQTLEIVDKYKDTLDIEIIVQHEGYIEESMNLFFNAAKDYDIALTLDDDAIPSSDWLKQHIYLHESFDKLGAIAGKVEPSSSPYKRGKILTQIYNSIGYDKPLFSVFRHYISYINDIGLFVFFNPKLGTSVDQFFNDQNNFLENVSFILSTGIGGANMSIKSKIIKDFQLPCATTRGIGYEKVLAVHIIKQGFHTAAVNSCNVKHLERRGDSLSRARSKFGRLACGLENYIQPYLVNAFQEIDLAKLNRYKFLVSFYQKLRNTDYSKVALRGLSLSITAIEEQWQPSRVRSMIAKYLEEYKSI